MSKAKGKKLSDTFTFADALSGLAEELERLDKLASRIEVGKNKDKDRLKQNIEKFFGEINWEFLESKLDSLDEVRDRFILQGEDSLADSVEEIIKLIETLQDTAETCGYLYNT